jgi:hypothetical protein
MGVIVMRVRVRSIILSAGLIGCAFSASAFAADVLIKIPCSTAPWLGCSEMQSQVVDGDPTNASTIGWTATVRKALDDVYLGTVSVAPSITGELAPITFDHLANPPICSPLKIPENGCVDETVKAYEVPKNVPPSCPAISKVGAATDDNPLFSLGRGGTGSMETSNVAAGLAMAISNQAADIRADILKNALVISAASPCNAKAMSLQQLIAAQSSVQLVAQLNACDPTDVTSNCSAKEYFKGTQTAILSAYVQLARCRLADEASGKFATFLSDSSTPYMTALYNLYLQQCFYPNRGNPTGMRSCYSAKYQAWIQARAAAAFPNVVAGCVGGSPSSTYTSAFSGQKTVK